MKLSARNTIKGTIADVRKGQTTAHVRLEVGGTTITASITNEAVEELKLARGMTAYAVIKASGAFSYCLLALNLVIDNFDGLSKFAAGIDRLDSFQKALQEAGVAAPDREAIRQRVGDELRLEHVTLRLPHSDRAVV